MSMDLIQFVQKSLKEKADPAKAAPMQAYMKTSMPFYGVQSAPRKKIAAQVKKQFPLKDNGAYRSMITSLWNLPHREEKYLALELACLQEKYVSHHNLDLYEKLVREGAWWDFVDQIAAHLVGEALAKEPDKIYPVMDKWVDDPDMWIRRTAILCQLTLKERTDQKRLFAYCLARCDENEFFIRKAIGWALRQYSYTAPDAVKGFLLEHRDKLSGLSYREGARNLKRQGLI